MTLVEIPYDLNQGTVNPEILNTYVHPESAALVIPQPNFLGGLEATSELTNWAHAHQLLVIGLVNPTSLALFAPPGEWGEEGADIACGEGQPLGIPLASGGPYFGFLCCKKKHIRQMPGRIVGRTLDLEGKIGYTLTLQAREQHIRRSKATSNICTNQGLMVTAATLYMALLGSTGLKQIASACHANTRILVDKLTKISGITRAFQGPYFHETVLRLDRPVKDILKKLAHHHILGGLDLSEFYPELGNGLLVCATEMRTSSEIDHYVQQLKDIF
jgi:glycine dehydrogenase subunit 1